MYTISPDFFEPWCILKNLRLGEAPSAYLAYQLFKEIEINLQDKLTNRLQPSSAPGNTKAEMVASVLLNDNVQFYWIMLSTDIQDEQIGQNLLREIIELWLTIRGFAVAREWMEMYKRCTSKATKKSKPLRKSLKKKSNT